MTDNTPTLATLKPLRAGIVGLGVGGAHADGYLRSPDTALVAICDFNEARLNERGEKYNVPAEGRFTNYKDMLATVPLDVVSICLPNSLHAEASIAAFEAGAHVICEKPMAPSVDEARDMLKAARLNDRKLMIAYNHRYRADMFWIRDMIQEGRLGQIYNIYAWWRRETGIPGSGWFSSRNMSGGGSLIDLGVHVLDMGMWLLGYPQPRTVTGDFHSTFGPRGQKVWGNPRWMGDTSAQAFDVEDSAIAFIRFEGGANMVLHATWAEHRQPQDDLIRLEIQGTEGTAVLSIPNYTRQDTLRFYTEMAGQPVTITPSVRWNGAWGHEGLIVDIVNSLRLGTTPPTNGEQGLASIRILEAIYASASTGREVVFDVVPGMMG